MVTRVSIIFFALLGSAFVSAESPVKREAEKEIAIVQDTECLAGGGFCTHNSKCPTDKISTTHECATQKDLGIVCCHSAISPNETECEKLTGACQERCPSNLIVSQATNCQEGELCCVLV